MSPLHSRYVNKIYKMQYKEKCWIWNRFLFVKLQYMSSQKYWNAGFVFQRKSKSLRQKRNVIMFFLTFHVKCQKEFQKIPEEIVFRMRYEKNCFCFSKVHIIVVYKKILRERGINYFMPSDSNQVLYFIRIV